MSRLLLALAAAAVMTASGPLVLPVSGSSGQGSDGAGEWRLARTEVNPTGDDFGETFTGSVSESSMSLTSRVGEATVSAEASWEPPDEVLAPGELFLVTVTASVSATGPGPAGYEFAVIPMVSGAWYRTIAAVTAGGRCGDPAEGGDPMDCSAETTTDVMHFEAPSGGETFDVGVAVLNCGGACEVRYVYEWSSASDPGPADSDDPSRSVEPRGPWTAERSAELLDALRADADLLDSQQFVWSALTEAIFEGRPAEEGLLVLRDLTDSFFDARIRRLEQAGGSSDPEVSALIEHLRTLRARRHAEIDQTIADVRAVSGGDRALDPTTVRAVLVDGADESVPDEGSADDAEAVDVLDAIHDGNEQSDVHQALDDQVARVLDDPPDDTEGDEREGRSSPSGTPATTPDQDDRGWADDPTSLDLRPVRFVNDGFTPVTVRAETFEPAPDLAGTAMSRASTVVFVDPNPSAYLDLPRGRYTFCYDWELGDVDGDDVTDYAHRITRDVSLTSDLSRDPARAPTVTLSPPSRTSTPNGRCASAGAGGGAGLTRAEESATTPATYTVTCDDADGSERTLVREYWFVFGGEGATWNDADPDAAPVELTRLRENTYELDGGSYRIELTETGFDLFSLVGDDPQFCRAVRQDS